MTFHAFDQDYVQRLKEGDPAVEQDFATYFGELLLLKLRMRLGSPESAEDVKQETLLRVLKTVRQGGGVDHPERFGAFVNAVCNNVVMEYRRSQTRHPQFDEEESEPPDRSVDLDAPLINRERKRKVEKVLSELPKKDQELLRAVFLEEREKKIICNQFDVNGEYLRVLLHRAKLRFRKLYESDAGN